MENPDKYLRKAYVDAFTPFGVFVGEAVPKDTPNPDKYIILTSQTKQRTAITKNDWEWLCQIQIDINTLQSEGYVSSVNAEDLEGQCITAIEAGINVNGFHVKSTDLVDSIPLDIDTKVGKVKRKRIIYEHWLCQV